MRRLTVLFLMLLVGSALAAAVALSAEAPPCESIVTSGNTVQVTFNAPVFRAGTEEALTADNFTPTPSGVQVGEDNKVYSLTYASVPVGQTMSLVGAELGNGTAARLKSGSCGLAPQVPLDLKQVADLFADVSLGDDFTSVPVPLIDEHVRGWLAQASTDAAGGYVPKPLVAGVLGTKVTFETSGEHAGQLKVEYTDPNGDPKTTWIGTHVALQSHLGDAAEVKFPVTYDVTYQAGVLEVTLEGTADVPDLIAGTLAVTSDDIVGYDGPEARVDLDLALKPTLGVAATLRLEKTDDGFHVVPGGTSVSVTPGAELASADGSSVTGSFGFLAASSPDASVTLAVPVDVTFTCPQRDEERCAASSLQAAAGYGADDPTVELSIPSLELDGGSAGTITIEPDAPTDPEEQADLLTVSGAWAVDDEEERSLEVTVELNLPTLCVADGAALLRVDDVLAGLAELTAVLEQVEDVATALDRPLPLIDGSVGDLASAANAAKGVVSDLTDAARAYEGMTATEVAAELAVAACEAAGGDAGDCEAAVGAFSVNGETCAVEFTVDLSETVPLFEVSPPNVSLAFDGADGLADMSVELTGGTWNATATSGLTVVLGLSLETPAQLLERLGLDDDNYDRDEEKNVDDPDADGDGLDDATEDPDDDADGIPDDLTADFEPAGTLCAALAAHLDVSSTALKTANANADDAACDGLVETGTVVKTSDDASRTLTSADECAVLAASQGVSADDLKAANRGDATEDLDDDACAALARDSILIDVVELPGPLTWADRVSIRPVEDGGTIASLNLGIQPTGVAMAARSGFGDLTVAQTDLRKQRIEPTVGVTLEGDRLSLQDLRMAVEQDRQARVADPDGPGHDHLLALFGLALDGQVHLKFDLTNELLGVASTLEIVGNLTALDNEGDEPYARLYPFGSNSLDGFPSGFMGKPSEGAGSDEVERKDTIHVVYDLSGGFSGLADLAIAHARSFVAEGFRQLDTLLAHDNLQVELPLADATVQDLLGLSDVAASVEPKPGDQQPSTVSDLVGTITDALATVGLQPEVSVALSKRQITLDLEFEEDGEPSFATSRDVPLQLDFQQFKNHPDMPDALKSFPLSPGEASATITASAAMQFDTGEGALSNTMSIGILLPCPEDWDTNEEYADDYADADCPRANDPDMRKKVFLLGTPVLVGDVASEDIRGDVFLGPHATGISGTAAANLTLGMAIPNHDPSDDPRVFADTIETLLTDDTLNVSAKIVEDQEKFKENGDDDLGPSVMAATLTFDLLPDATFGVESRVKWAVDRAAGVDTSTTAPELEPRLELNGSFDLADAVLNLGNFVRGTVATARTISRTLEDGDLANLQLPIVGGSLLPTSEASRAISDLADVVERGWNAELAREEAAAASQRRGDGGVPVTSAQAKPFDQFVEDELAALGAQVEVTYLTKRGKVTDTLSKAFGIELTYRRAEATGGSETTFDGGIDVGGFELGGAIAATPTAGYEIDLTIGVDPTTGFYLKKGDLFELYGSLDVTSLPSATVDLGPIGAAQITDGHLRIGAPKGDDDALAGAGPGSNSSHAGIVVTLDENLTLADLTDRVKPIDEILAPQLRAAIDLGMTLQTTSTLLPTATIPLGLEYSLVADPDTTVLPKPTLHIGTAATPVTISAGSVVDNLLGSTLADLAAYNPVAKAKIVDDVLGSTLPVVGGTVQSHADRLLANDTNWKVFTFLRNMKPGDKKASGDLRLGRASISEDRVEVYTADGDGGAITSLTSAVGDVGSYSSPIVSFPFVHQKLDTLKLLLGLDGDDVSFVEVRPPALTAGPSINRRQQLAKLDWGILKGDLNAGINGNIGLTLDVGFGYDSSGLRSGRPENGLYLLDRDAMNRERNEIGLGGSIGATIDGKVAVEIAGVSAAKAEFDGRGGVYLNGGLDLYDESQVLELPGRGDGKFHLDEIQRVLKGHTSPSGTGVECLFQARAKMHGDVGVNARAYVAGIEVWSDGYSQHFPVFDHTAQICPYATQPARMVGADLVLNAGPDAPKRFADTTAANETFTITQNGDNLEVTYGSTKVSYAAEGVDRIVADLGDGNDRLTVAASVTIPVVVDGGPGDDTITGGGGDDIIDGGDGADTLDGGAGDDRLSAGRWDEKNADGVYAAGTPTKTQHLTGGDGDDELIGGPGPDVVDGGAGDDILRPGPGDDTISIGDGWGTDDLVDTGGRDTLRFVGSTGVRGSSSYGEGIVRPVTEGAPDELIYRTADLETIQATAAGDVFELGTDAPDGLRLDGAGGDDRITVPLALETRTLTAVGGPGHDTLVVRGSESSDTLLLRAYGEPGHQSPATSGFVARLGYGHAGTADALPAPTSFDRISYTDDIESLVVDPRSGNDRLALDDVAAPLTVLANPGDDHVQVGQAFKEDRSILAGVDPAFDDRTIETEESPFLSQGVSHETTVNGGEGDDTFQVYATRGVLRLNGDAGSDTFIVRAFIQAGTFELGGGDGPDHFEYVRNELIDIKGGRGFDTMVLLGTPADDGLRLEAAPEETPDPDASSEEAAGPAADAPEPADPSEAGPDTFRVEFCPIVVDPETGARGVDTGATGCAGGVLFAEIESVIAHGLQGSDLFEVVATPENSTYHLYGGEQGDTFRIGLGDLSSILGPVVAEGEGDPNLDVALRLPVVLPGEEGTRAEVDLAKFDHWDKPVDDVLIVDASEHTGDAGGVLTRDHLSGFRMVDDHTIDGDLLRGGLAYDQMESMVLVAGSGGEQLTIESTHAGTTHTRLAGGVDTVNVEAVNGPTTVEGGPDDDRVTVSRGGLVSGVKDGLTVIGGDGSDDRLTVDDRYHVLWATADLQLDLERLTGLGLPEGTAAVPGVAAIPPTATAPGIPGAPARPAVAAGILFPGVEVLQVHLGRHDEHVSIRGTSAATTIDAADGDEEFQVSADAGPSTYGTDHLGGHVDRILRPLTLEAGPGDHTLQVSDEGATAGDLFVRVSDETIEGLSAGPIRYGAAGGTFRRGVTVWTSQHADAVTVLGGRHEPAPSRTITTINLGGGNDAATVAAADGFLVINGEEGDDAIDASGSTVPVVVFGGAGGDDLTGGSQGDLLIGDEARITYGPTADDSATIVGGGGPGDRTNGLAHPIATITTVEVVDGAAVRLDRAGSASIDGAADRIAGGGGPDVVFGGVGDDHLSGGDGDDVLLGDHGWFRADWVAPQYRSLGADVQLGAGHDTIEGGPGRDWILGQFGNDQIHAGADDDLVAGGHDQAGGLDGADRISGDAGDDTIAGDNALLLSRADVTLHDANAPLTAASTGDISGDDIIDGGAGVDHVFGQRGADVLRGGADSDAIVGDFGVVTTWVALGQEHRIRTSAPFIDETVWTDGTVVHDVRLEFLDVGGADTMFGDDGGDALHGGPGSDLANGGAGDDAIFGGDGDDALWGGLDHDRIYGGWGADSIDVKPRETDPASWWSVAPAVDTDGDAATVNGRDVIYGGWGPDAMQADTGDAGPTPGDRLIDWVGAYNAYYVCEGAYGAGRVQRQSSPDMMSVLQQLAAVDGAFDVTATGSSGHNELGLVTNADGKRNSSPKHPDHPGNFTCEGAAAADSEASTDASAGGNGGSRSRDR